jgi:competence protein ComEC
MLLAACGFCLGIVDARWVWHPPLLWLLTAILGAWLTLAALRRVERFLWLPLLLVWFSAGQFAWSVAPTQAPSPELHQYADRLQRVAIGSVSALHPVQKITRYQAFSDVQSVETTTQVDLNLDSIEDVASDRDAQVPIQGGLRLSLYAKPGEKLPALRCGQSIRVPVRLSRPGRYLDPGAWNYADYLRQHGIAVLGNADAGAVQFTPGARTLSLACWASAAQLWAGERLDRIAQQSTSAAWLPASLRLRGGDADILRAMLFGDRSHLRHALRIGFERTGSFHLLVVSGLHITIVIALCFWLARKAGAGEVAASAIALTLALPYALLTGFAPPVQRALWLSAVYLICRILYRERAAMNAIAIAALSILALRPNALFDSSFQMTMLAVLSIAGVAAPLLEATIAPYLRGLRTVSLPGLDPHLPARVTQMRVSLRMFSEHLRPFLPKRWASALPVGLLRWLLRALEAMLVSLVVELAMMLPMAVYFHRITLLALPANLLGLPMLALLLPCALLTFLLGCAQPMLALPSASITALLLHCITGIITYAGKLAATGMRTPDPPLWTMLLFATTWIAALWLVRAGKGWRWCALAAITIGSACVIWPQPPALHPGVLEVTAIDVGQGDSIFVSTPDGRTLLIDAGGPIGPAHTEDSSFDVGEDVVSQYLWTRGIRALDAVALTHAHSDHMGGMPAVLANFHPRALWVGNNPLVPAYMALLADAKQAGTRVESWHAGESFSFGSTKVRVLAPAPGYLPGKQPSNDDSLVLRIAYGETAAILEGDAQARTEARMVADDLQPAALLKVGHHGSCTSTTPAFLAAVSPSYAVISDGRNNPFGHPCMPVLNALASMQVRVYRTDTLGLSTFFLNGKSVQALPR